MTLYTIFCLGRYSMAKAAILEWSQSRNYDLVYCCKCHSTITSV